MVGVSRRLCVDPFGMAGRDDLPRDCLLRHNLSSDEDEKRGQNARNSRNRGVKWRFYPIQAQKFRLNH